MDTRLIQRLVYKGQLKTVNVRFSVPQVTHSCIVNPALETLVCVQSIFLVTIMCQLYALFLVQITADLFGLKPLSALFFLFRRHGISFSLLKLSCINIFMANATPNRTAPGCWFLAIDLETLLRVSTLAETYTVWIKGDINWKMIVKIASQWEGFIMKNPTIRYTQNK